MVLLAVGSVLEIVPIEQFLNDELYCFDNFIYRDINHKSIQKHSIVKLIHSTKIFFPTKIFEPQLSMPGSVDAYE